MKDHNVCHLVVPCVEILLPYLTATNRTKTMEGSLAIMGHTHYGLCIVTEGQYVGRDPVR